MNNKILMLCEGPNEKKVIELLLAHDLLRFSSEDLIGLVPYHARQLHAPILIPILHMYHEIFDIYRIGDKQNEKLKIPKDLKPRIGDVLKFCTKPELEILLIINEGLYKQYLSHGKGKPNQFAKERIRIGKHRYDNSSTFYEDYYCRDISMLVQNLREYKRIKKHENGEFFLADLLK